MVSKLLASCRGKALGYGDVKPHRRYSGHWYRAGKKAFDYYILIFHAHASNISSRESFVPRGISGEGGGEGSEIVF